METYSKAFTVTNNMLDAFDNLRMSSILDISQEIAGDHANLLHVGFDEFIKRNYIWVILRNKVEVIKNVTDLKSVRCVTNLAKPRFFEFPRDYLFYQGEDLIIKSRSIWAIYDLNLKKVVIPNDIKSLFVEDEGYFDRIRKLPVIKKEDLAFYKDIEVTFSMLDHNGHMNNTRCADIFLDVFNLKKEEKIKSFQIEYVSQSFLNDKISLFTKIENNIKYLFGYNNDELKFYMEVEFF